MKRKIQKANMTAVRLPICWAPCLSQSLILPPFLPSTPPSVYSHLSFVLHFGYSVWGELEAFCPLVYVVTWRTVSSWSSLEQSLGHLWGPKSLQVDLGESCGGNRKYDCNQIFSAFCFFRLQPPFPSADRQCMVYKGCSSAISLSAVRQRHRIVEP